MFDTVFLFNPLLRNPDENPFQKIVGKKENAVNEHFRHFPQFFFNLSKTSSFFFFKFLTLYHTIPTFNYPNKETF